MKDGIWFRADTIFEEFSVKKSAKKESKDRAVQLFARVEELRLWRGWSEEELSARAGIPYRQYQKFISDGENLRMTMHHVFPLSEALKVTPVALFQLPKGLKAASAKKRSEQE